jgi:pimeloyl-ACP methyl ester carboxylesterase
MRNGIVRGGPDSTYADGDDASWMDVDWPALQRPVELLGRSVNVLDTGGDGPPLLWIHGWSANWQSWLLTIPYFMREHRCIALDLPGFGASDMPSTPISIQGYAKTVDALCRALGVDRVAVVGNSMGGFVGAELAIRHPQRVERLMLVSAAGITTTDLYRAPVAALARAGTMVIGYTAARHRQLARRPISRHLALSLVARHPSRLAPDLAYEAMFKGAGKPGFDDALAACLDYDFRERLPEIACPTLVVWGENDAVLPAGDADEFERLIPDARKLVMRDTGHVPMLERPTTFNDMLADFMAETGSAEAREPVPGAAQVA